MPFSDNAPIAARGGQRRQFKSRPALSARASATWWEPRSPIRLPAPITA